MTPKQYVEEVVLPTVDAFRRDRRSRRKAYLACITVNHIVDYLTKSGRRKEEIVQIMRLRDKQGPYDVVKAICDAAKHCGHDRPHNVSFEIASDYDRPPAIAGLMVCGLSRVGDGVGGREFRLEGSTVDIYWSVASLMKHFSSNFSELAEIDLSEI